MSDTETSVEGRPGVDAAVASANAVFHNPRSAVPHEPAGREECVAAVEALGRAFAGAGGTVLEIIENSRGGAESLSGDPLQGLSEVIQNANDTGATRVEFTLDQTRLLVKHNGRPVNLRDLHAMAAPWLTTKQDDSTATGRFGIGLSTLHALSPTFEIHSGHYHVEIGNPFLTNISAPNLPSDHVSPDDTVLQVPLAPGAITDETFWTWCDGWNDSGLLFLSHVNTVIFRSGTDERILGLRRSPIGTRDWSVDAKPTVIKSYTVEAPDQRRWLLSTAEVPTPTGLRRAHKSTGETTSIGVALPLQDVSGPQGQLFAGLPVAHLEDLPAQINAQFDPMTNRQSLRDNEWNRALVALVGQLWGTVIRDLFSREAPQGWRCIPLNGSSPAPATGLVAHLDEYLRAATNELALDLQFRTAHGARPLTELAVETPELHGLVSEDDVALLAGLDATLCEGYRDADDRWRQVHAQWRANGIPLPTPVGVKDAIRLLAEEARAPEDVIKLSAAALAAGLGDDLLRTACIVDTAGHHHCPPGRDDPVVLVEHADGLPEALGMAVEIHPAYLADDPTAVSVRAWLSSHAFLLDTGDTHGVLSKLAAAGEAGSGLASALTDVQIAAIREALEPLGTDVWQELGPGLGKAVTLEAFRYDDAGQRHDVTARPCDAYQPRAIDREPDSFAAAADTTPGLTWLMPRYAQVLRSSLGRAGLGPQRFLRHLGCATTPRIAPHRRLTKKYQSSRRRGLAHWFWDGVEARTEALRDLNSNFTLDDWESPDLIRVLQHIADESSAKQRRQRAAAILGLLGRTWRDMGERAEVQAANAYNGWHIHGTTRAYWAWEAATIPWLDGADGKPTAPISLRRKTTATRAVFGTDASGYLHSHFDTARDEVLDLLGVSGEPATRDLLIRLKGLQESATQDDNTHVETAAVYQALSNRITAGRDAIGLTTRQLRAEFSARSGLIYTTQGWKQPVDVLQGDPIFGERRTFVPGVPNTTALWNALGIREPGIDDCIQVLSEIARSKADPSPSDQVVMLETFRLLLAKIDAGESLNPRRKRRLANLTLWTSHGWISTRPVYAVPDPQLANALGETHPVWQPGGEATQFDALLGPLRVTPVSQDEAQVLSPESAYIDSAATARFAAAARLLKEDLVRNDVETERSILVPWDRLTSLQVRVHPNLEIEVPIQGIGPLVVPIAAKADATSGSIYVDGDPELVFRADVGGRAVASLFRADQRAVAQAWLAAVAAEQLGREAQEMRLAHEQAAVESDAVQVKIDRLRDQIRDRRSSSKEQEERAGRTGQPMPRSGSPDTVSTATESAATSPRPRILVDPDTLTVLDPDGRVHDPTPTPPPPHDGARRHQDAKRSEPDLPSPRPGGAAPQPGLSQRDYSDQQKETLGLQLARMVLATDHQALIDIRAQHRVGADAVDDLGQFFELKVSARDEPNQIRLTQSEIRRAMSTPDFFLVVVSGIEGTNARPKVRIIVDPLNQLSISESSQVLFSGVHQAESLVFDLAPRQEELNEQ